MEEEEEVAATAAVPAHVGELCSSSAAGASACVFGSESGEEELDADALLNDRARQSQVLRLKRYLDSTSFGGGDSNSKSSGDAEAHH